MCERISPHADFRLSSERATLPFTPTCRTGAAVETPKVTTPVSRAYPQIGHGSIQLSVAERADSNFWTAPPAGAVAEAECAWETRHHVPAFVDCRGFSPVARLPAPARRGKFPARIASVPQGLTP